MRGGGPLKRIYAVETLPAAESPLRVILKRGAHLTLTPDEVAQLLSRFTDRAQIASWAESSIAAAVKVGLLSGNSDGSVAPRATTTRAMAMVVANRVLRIIFDL